MFNKYKVYKFYKLSSTNTYLSKNIDKYNNLSLIISSIQEQGKGRNKKVWESSSNSNLYFSILIKDTSFIKVKTHFPILVAVSLFNSIKYFSDNVKIKWPNDIVEDSKVIKKISGVLIEDFNNYLVLGIGVNLKNSPNLDSNYKAQDIYSLLKTSISKFSINLTKLSFIRIYMQNFKKVLSKYKQGTFSNILNYYNEHLFMKNKNVFINDNIIRHGTLMGIDENGFLILKENNKIVKIFNGEIKISCN